MPCLMTLKAKEQGGVSESAPKDKMQVLRVQVEEVTEQMKENVEQIVERGEKGLVLLATSEKMEKEAQHFKQTSQNVARTYWWKNVKLVVVIVVVVLIIVLIIVLLATGVIPVSAPAANPSIKP
ncbi:vesicle-associated membrane protein 8-like [Anoplopoma fimbria]|uniref:vesicle-associated membrane protein 8-like n=1 Tax=Anoplopoma fimbria TaxID=229290 RepID=UPI0023ED9CF4|nr:vesicle-associated membrane protein 8-like [Anoplopoma fimbria]